MCLPECPLVFEEHTLRQGGHAEQTSSALFSHRHTSASLLLFASHVHHVWRAGFHGSTPQGCRDQMSEKHHIGTVVEKLLDRKKLEERKASSEMNYAFRNVHGLRPICAESDPNRTLDWGFLSWHFCLGWKYRLSEWCSVLFAAPRSGSVTAAPRWYME